MKINRNGKAEPLTRREAMRVLGELRHPHRLIFAISWFTAERPGAVLRLRVEDVYAGPRQLNPEIVFPARNRKDRQTRSIPIAHDLQRELRAYDPPAGGYLFPGQGQTGHLTFSAYYKALMRAFERLGMKGYSPYSTRRGALSELARSGLSLPAIARVSGHRSLRSLEIYLEANPADVARAIALL